MSTKQDIRDGCAFSVGATIWIILIGALIILGSIYGVIALKSQHDIINPQIRQNMVDNPAHSIATKQDFHSKLSLIISADQNVLDALNCASNCDDLQLTGLKQIRNKAINDYNAQSDNPDAGKYREAWMPKHIDTNVIPVQNDKAQTFLQDEIKTLQEAYNKGV